MGNIKKAKKNYTPKFGKPKQMKHTDYHSSSSDDEAEQKIGKRTLTRKTPAAKAIATVEALNDENRLSDDSEHNFSDDDAAEDGEDVSDVEFDDEAEESTEETVAKPLTGSAGEEDEEDDEDADDDAEESTGEEGNADWAKSLAKILKEQKPKHKKIVALSKAKKTSDIVEAREQAKRIGFAIDGEIKEEKPDADALDVEVSACVEERRRRKRAAFELRMKPTLMDRDRERAFKKIATKGMVQLFNAVRTQQKDLSAKLKEAGRLDHRRDAVLNNIDKRQFLDVLMGGKRAKSENVDNPVKDEEDDDMDDAVYNDGLPKNSIWSVLKEDFLSNKKLSHWDKDEEEDEAPNTDNEDDE